MGASLDENTFFSSSYVVEYLFKFKSYLGLKMDACLLEKTYILLKKLFFLKLNLQDESHLHANCLFCILVFYCKCFSFQFLYCGIHIHSSIPIVAQNGLVSSRKKLIFYWKMLFLKLNFKDEDQLYANCLFRILSHHRKCFIFLVLKWLHTDPY